MRLFFALDIDKEMKNSIATWRQQLMPGPAKPVAKNNLHITLQFLGTVSDEQYQTVVEQGSKIEVPPFKMRLNNYGCWKKPGIFWLAPDSTPEELNLLATALRQCALQAGIESEKRPYKPHLTLFRKFRRPVLEKIIQPDFALSFSNFSLFESISTKQGVHYKEIKRWNLIKTG